MKKGKTSKLSGYKNTKVTYGTVDSKELKSIYINFQSWLSPTKEFEKWNKPITILQRNIKQVVTDTIDKKLFKENFIIDLDVKMSGLSYGKKSFGNLEITLFTNQNIDFRETIIKDNIKEICDSIYVDCFINSDDFIFSLSKKEPQMEY
jgi:hypothetical protein